jgi:curved DNA-binding protein CbpA
MEPTARGILAKTPLAHLVVYCLDRQLGGTLVLRPEGDDRDASADAILFERGAPAKIRIADPVEHLGRVLLELGAIDDATYNGSLAALGRGEGLHGEILRRRGAIDDATLEKALRIQTTRKLGLLFGRPETTRFAFYEGVDLLARYGGPELHPIDPAPVVFAALRVFGSEAHADATIARVSSRPLRVRAGVELGGFEITRVERDLIALLRLSPMTAGQLAGAGVADPRAAKLFVYALLLLKKLEPIAEGEVVARGTSPAIAKIATPPRALDRNPSPVARIALARVPTPMPASSIVETGGGDGRESVSRPSAALRVPSPVARTTRPPMRSDPPKSDPARRAEIAARAAAVATDDLFAVLGLPRGAGVAEAKAAYFALVKRWHPDRLPPDLADVKDDVARVFARIAEAYQTLGDETKRARYLEELERGATAADEQAEVARVMEASNAFAKALFFVGKGQLAEAAPFAKKAFDLEPSDPDHVAVWAFLQSGEPERRAKGRYDDLLGLLDRAVASNPHNERARYYRGVILKSAGRLGEAIRDFRAVVDANPKHVDAAREVRLHQMREKERPKSDEPSGLLGRFIKRK